MGEYPASSATPDDSLMRSPSVSEVLVKSLTEGSASPSVLLESLYYASEPDLFVIMRLVATLDPELRSRVMDFCKRLHGDEMV